MAQLGTCGYSSRRASSCSLTSLPWSILSSLSKGYEGQHWSTSPDVGYRLLMSLRAVANAQLQCIAAYPPAVYAFCTCIQPYHARDFCSYAADCYRKRPIVKGQYGSNRKRTGLVGAWRTGTHRLGPSLPRNSSYCKLSGSAACRQAGANAII